MRKLMFSGRLVRQTSRWKVTGLAALLVTAAACSRDPETLKVRAIEKGDRYTQQGKQPEAIIEYSNAVQAVPKDGAARLKLAEAYSKAGNSAAAAHEYVRAAD